MNQYSAIICELNGMSGALDAYIDIMDDQIAMESANSRSITILKDRVRRITQMKKDMKKEADQGNYKEAAKIARDIAAQFTQYQQDLNNIPPDKGSAIVIDAILAILAVIAAGIIAYGTMRIVTRKKRKEITGKHMDNASTQLHYAASVRSMSPKSQKLYNDTMAEWQRLSKELGSNHPDTRKAAKKMSNLLDQLNDLNKNNPAFHQKVTDTLRHMHDTNDKQFTDILKTNINLRNKEITPYVKKGVRVGQIIGGTVTGSILAKLGIFHQGDRGKRELNVNDFNALMNAMKKDCQKGKDTFTKLAAEYEAKSNMRT